MNPYFDLIEQVEPNKKIEIQIEQPINKYELTSILENLEQK
jgi:hypothetical protein